MTAKPGLPQAWPRRRRVAGFARGSASGGTVPIPVRMGRRAELHRDLVQRLRALPGVGVKVADSGDTTTITLDSPDTEVLAPLPPKTIETAAAL